ncbi:MAG: hypothetical protein K2J77_13085 [Oscillospiraceae bacterium]|nr:hypothetical protein [Oscillospiraceae bacterium]
MKKLIVLFVAIFVLAIPLISLIAEHDARESEELPAVGSRRIEVTASGGTPANAVTRKKSINTAPYTTQECIAAINAGYEQIWEQEQSRVPKADAPAVRYAISDDERREIEHIVASEGGYCDYEFQALVALCILNGAESEGLRPSELFARGDFWLTHDVEPTETTKRAVSDVFDCGIFPTPEPVRYYYNPKYCKSDMHESFCYVLTCCDCRFFKDWE